MQNRFSIIVLFFADLSLYVKAYEIHRVQISTFSQPTIITFKNYFMENNCMLEVIAR